LPTAINYYLLMNEAHALRQSGQPARYLKFNHAFGTWLP